LHFAVKKLQTKIQKYGLFFPKNISFMEVPKSMMTKKRVKGTSKLKFAELSSAHHRSQAKCQLR